MVAKYIASKLRRCNLSCGDGIAPVGHGGLLQRSRCRYSPGVAATDLAAARRAADVFVAAGVGRVLLFGPVARGEACADSDIDLVAIYDDLDYSERAERRCALESSARTVAGCDVDVFVTDAPEWAVRTKLVPCSLEARIAAEAIELVDVGEHFGIDWGKEIGLPRDIAGELQNRFIDLSNAVVRLESSLRPSQAEADAAADGDEAEVTALEDIRFATVMGEVHMLVECAAKVTHIVNVGTTPPHSYNILMLLAPQPPELREAFDRIAGSSVNLGELHLWRQGATYTADQPEARFDEATLRTYATFALEIAALAARECTHEGISELVLASFHRRADRCRAALDGPVRHQ